MQTTMDYEDQTNEERQAPAVQSTEQPVLQDQEDDDKSNMKLPDEDMFYNYEELYSRPFITPHSEIPENLLHLSHSFGYDCERRANLQLLDDRTLAFIAGNLVVLLDVSTKEQHYLRSCSGGGIGTIMAHPSKRYFAVAEKGDKPDIIVYDYPSLRPYRILRGGTERAYSCVDFNHDGTLLASVGCIPDCMLTLWDWRQEQVLLRCKAFARDIYRVTFSPDRPGQLTTSAPGHIKFWKMTSTFTGLKLQGLTGRFGKTAPTDIKGYIELPDGKVVSGSEWGNMLLWEGGLLKVEICRKGGRTCHTGAIQQFTLDEGELMTIGSDGAIRSWDFESVDTADCNDDSEMFEMEPMNELVVGRDVSLSSMVRSSQADSFIWFAQDSNGGIWKLDLSFSNITQDPECLFSFHAGAIQGMDVSRISHLMATTSLDCSVKVYDFLAKRELTTSQFKQGGTALSWAPPVVSQRGGLLVTGFEDGVVRLLELYDPQSLQRSVAGRQGNDGEAELHLKQAFKPHTAPVTAIAYERNGEILATGSSDCTVFFFTAREQYNPIGFVQVPGPVQQLEWSPQSHSQNTLLILCASGHVVEVQSPDPEDPRPGKTYQLSELPARSFTFRSIKSRIKREAAVARRQEMKLRKASERAGRLKRARESSGQEADDEEHEEENEEEEESPPIYIPDPPSPLCCGFYSEPGQFWLSMGGYDAGFLYHCKFSETQDADPSQLQDADPSQLQDADPSQLQDEPFAFLPVLNTGEEDPILTISFSSDRQLMLCGMHSGTIRVYPLQPGDHLLTSMQAYWSLSVHDNQYGHLRHVRCSHDDQFVLTAGDDGNIFSFSLLPPEELQRALRRKKAKVPSPRPGVEAEGTAADIEDPAAYSIATAKQKLEMDHLRREAEQRKVERRKTLVDLQNQFKLLLHQNLHGLPEHVRLQSMELDLDCRFREEAERLKVERVKEVRRELIWEEERHRIALHKIQQFWDSLGSDTVTVVAVRSDHRVSTYRLPALSQPAKQLEQRSHTGSVVQEHETPPSEGQGSQVIEELDDLTGGAVLSPVAPPGGLKLASRQAEKLRKAAEKAERAKAKIEKRKKEWAEFYAAKPNENSEDPKDVLAIQHATENMGDLRLKTAKDFTVPEHLRMNAEKKRAELVALEEKIHEKKTAMNARVVALRDAKVSLISRLRSRARRLQRIQQRLAPHLHRPLPPLPCMVAEETPETRLRPGRATLERYGALLAQSSHTESQDEGGRPLLEQLGKEREGDEEEEEEEDCSGTSLSVEVEAGGGVELTEVEEEVLMEEEITSMYEQDSVLEQMETWAWRFDAELRLLRHHKLLLDGRLKLADLQHVRLYQELRTLRRLEDSESSLQEALNARMKKEESDIRSKLEECNRQLDLKRRNVAKLQEREKAMMAAFQAMLGETKCADLLTKVFRKKIKRVKEKEKKARDEEEEDGGGDGSDEEAEWGGDADYSGSESSGTQLDDSVCPADCDPQLFEKTVRLREHRLDLEELQAEEKRSAEALKKDCDSLLKKEKVVQSSLKAAEGELELFNREKQQRLNEVDVVVPLRLHQIVSDGMVPSDLSSALALNRATLSRLQERIKELHVENSKQGDLYRGARKQHVQLIHDRRDMESKIHELEERCQQMMMMKFGKLVDLEALQTLSGSRTLEEMRQESQLRQAGHDTQIKQWEVKVMQAREALMEVTRCNTERLLSMNSLLHQKNQLEDTLNTRQKKMVGQLEGQCRWVEEEEAHKLQELVRAQARQAEALRREMVILSRKGGHILPPSHAPLPPSTHPSHRPGGRLYRLGHAQPTASSQGAD